LRARKGLVGVENDHVVEDGGEQMRTQLDWPHLYADCGGGRGDI
jgi:hypothetical protein